MPDSRAGHHANVGYVFENEGYDTDPSDTSIKPFGGNATMDTFEASEQAVRVYNASRTAAEIIAQNFDGGWGVTCELTEPPWWLASILGQPTSTQVSGSLYDYSYDLANDNDPVPLRIYAPTDGFSEYKFLPGCYAVSVSVDQSEDGNPELNITGGYARDPEEDTTVDTTIPDFSESSLTNRDAELTVGGTTVGRAQNTSLSIETNTDGISEIGTGNMVDFSPKAFTPDVTHDKIVFVGQSEDHYQRFYDGEVANVVLAYDNGLTGEDEFSLDFTVVDSFPDTWNESGRNDPDADLTEELQEMGEDLTATLTTSAGDSGNPPGITL